jgi:hypothetical protein
VALGLGFHTRIANLGCWLLATSLDQRNPALLIGGDTVLRLLLFWSLFLPLGARASLDARRPGEPREGRALGVASAALLLQVAVVYVAAAAWKRREPVWQQLHFLHEALRVDGVATALGRKLLALPDLLPGLTWAALQLETWGVLLAFSPFATGPLRALAVVLFVAFHAALGATLSLGLFPLAMMVAWTAFLPSWLFDRLRGAAPPSPPIRRSHGAVDFLAGCALILVALQNVAALPGHETLARSAALSGATRWLGLEQGWSLWTQPPTNRYYVFSARLRDGREVDLHRGGAPLDFEAPRRSSANNRWWKYQLLVSSVAGPPHRPLYVDYLTRAWNRDHPPEQAVESLELWLIEDVGAPTGDTMRRRRRLWPPGPR